jgi:hypothetical protein
VLNVLFTKQFIAREEYYLIKLKNLKDLGYITEVIWQYDYKINKDFVLLELINEQENKDINDK